MGLRRRKQTLEKLQGERRQILFGEKIKENIIGSAGGLYTGEGRRIQGFGE